MLCEGCRTRAANRYNAHVVSPARAFHEGSVEGDNRVQSTLFPESLDDYIAENNPVRVVDVFVEELDLKALGFTGAEPEATVSRSPAVRLLGGLSGSRQKVRPIERTAGLATTVALPSSDSYIAFFRDS
jgi:hypothetical protein